METAGHSLIPRGSVGVAHGEHHSLPHKFSQMTQLTSRVHAVATAIGLTYGSTIIGSVVVSVAIPLLTVVGIDVEARPWWYVEFGLV